MLLEEIYFLEDEISRLKRDFSRIALDEQNYSRSTRNLAIDFGRQVENKMRIAQRMKGTDPRRYKDELDGLLTTFEHKGLTALEEEGHDYRTEGVPDSPERV